MQQRMMSAGRPIGSVADMHYDWHLDYIRAVLAATGLSATALAAKTGIASSTLTRALNNPDHKFRLSLTTLNKIRDATGVCQR